MKFKTKLYVVLEVEAEYKDLFPSTSDAACWMDVRLNGDGIKVESTVYGSHLWLLVDEINTNVEHEGWALFDYDCTGLLQIQRIDERVRFDSDEAAIDHVKRCANDNLATHKLALALHQHFESAIRGLK